MNQRRKNVPRARSASASGPCPSRSVYSRMRSGAATMDTMRIAVRTTTVIDRTEWATSHASSRPRVSSHSTNTGTNTEVRTPPRISSYTMFGVLLAML